MNLKDVMTREVEVVRPDTTLQEAARRMRDLDVGPMPVCDGERLVGMLTDRDIAIRAVAEGRDPTTTQVQEVMTGDVVYCFEDQGIEAAARLMQERQIRRLLVLNRNKRLVGIVSLGDLAVETNRMGMDDASDTVEDTLEAISQPSRPTG